MFYGWCELTCQGYALSGIPVYYGWTVPCSSQGHVESQLSEIKGRKSGEEFYPGFALEMGVCSLAHHWVCAVCLSGWHCNVLWPIIESVLSACQADIVMKIWNKNDCSHCKTRSKHILAFFWNFYVCLGLGIVMIISLVLVWSCLTFSFFITLFTVAAVNTVRNRMIHTLLLVMSCWVAGEMSASKGSGLIIFFGFRYSSH